MAVLDAVVQKIFWNEKQRMTGNTRNPRRMAWDIFISCPVENLHFGGPKAGGRRQEAEGKKRRLREKVFGRGARKVVLSRYYPDMILVTAIDR
ncbi:MAG: hypothetical protein SWX82_27125 [Cyanobacteriota bacterium]|nr:hypothetical protein [Cyanobacteriota bacterium]